MRTQCFDKLLFLILLFTQGAYTSQIFYKSISLDEMKQASDVIVEGEWLGENSQIKVLRVIQSKTPLMPNCKIDVKREGTSERAMMKHIDETQGRRRSPILLKYEQKWEIKKGERAIFYLKNFSPDDYEFVAEKSYTKP